MILVLYVDDEMPLLDIGKLFLERTGSFSVETAASARDALDTLRTRPIDCIVSDYQMPVMDGLELLKTIRSAGNQIPFILFTGRGREEVVIEALNNGADYYLQKGGEPKSQFVELSHKIRLATEQRKIQKALIDSEQRYRAVVEDQTEYISRFKPDGTHIFVNAAYCKIFGKPPDEIIGTRIHPNVPKEDMNRIQKHLSSLTPEHPSALLEHRIIMPDGRVRWHQWNDRAFFDEGGTVIEYQSVGRDITEKRLAEEELRAAYEQLAATGEELQTQFDELREREEEIRQSEQKLQGIVHGSPIPQFVIDTNHRVISWNKALEEISGVRGSDILGTTDAWKAFYPENRPVLADLLIDEDIGSVERLYRGKYAQSRYVEGAYEAIDFFPYPDKKGVWLYFTASVIRDNQRRIIGAVETLEDITRLKEKERALIESKTFLDKIINTIGDPVFVKDKSHRWILVNDELCRYMGYPRESLLGRTDHDFFPKEEADVFWEKDEEVFHGSGENINEEAITDSQGITHIIVTKKTLYTDTTGTPFIVGVIRDITEQKRSELRLRESEQKFRAIFNQTYQFISLLTTDGILVDANQTSLDLIGLPLSAVMGRPFWETPWWKHSNKHRKQVQDAIAIAASGRLCQFEATHLDADEILHYVDFSLKPVMDDNEKAMYLVAEGRDISRRKEAEEILTRETKRIEILLELSHLVGNGEEALIARAVEFGKELTASNAGYLATLNEEGDELTLRYASPADMVPVPCQDTPVTCPVKNAGFWENVIRKGETVIHNTADTLSSGKEQAGGRVFCHRHICIPIVDNGIIVGLAGFCNRDEAYSDNDARQIQLLMSGLWQILIREQAEENLKASEERYYTLFEEAGDIICILDQQGTILDLNRKFEQESGYSRDQIIGKTVAESGLVTASSLLTVSSHLKQIFLGKTTPIFLILGISNNGIEIRYEIRLSPVKKAGKIIAAQAILRNLSERKPAEEAADDTNQG